MFEKVPQQPLKWMKDIDNNIDAEHQKHKQNFAATHLDFDQ